MAEEILPIRTEEPAPATTTSAPIDISDPTTANLYQEEILPRPLRLSPTRIVQVKVFHDSTTVSAGDGEAIFLIPPEYNNLDLHTVYAYVTTVSSAGTPTVQVRNITQGVDMLSTPITIDANELSSITAATQPVKNPTYTRVRSGDQIALDIDVAGTGAKGLGVVLTFK